MEEDNLGPKNVMFLALKDVRKEIGYKAKTELVNMNKKRIANSEFGIGYKATDCSDGRWCLVFKETPGQGEQKLLNSAEFPVRN